MVGDSAVQLNRRQLLARFVPENLMRNCQSQLKYLACKMMVNFTPIQGMQSIC